MKAISPVIATVIIVAVAIAISIAVALWMTGITTTFTGLEKLEIVNAYATRNKTSGWDINITVKNTGTKSTTIDKIFINNLPIDTTSDLITKEPSSWTLDPGDSDNFVIHLDSSETIASQSVTFTNGQTVSIVVHTASGGQYPATVTLP